MTQPKSFSRIPKISPQNLSTHSVRIQKGNQTKPASSKLSLHYSSHTKRGFTRPDPFKIFKGLFDSQKDGLSRFSHQVHDPCSHTILQQISIGRAPFWFPKIHPNPPPSLPAPQGALRPLPGHSSKRSLLVALFVRKKARQTSTTKEVLDHVG